MDVGIVRSEDCSPGSGKRLLLFLKIYFIDNGLKVVVASGGEILQRATLDNSRLITIKLQFADTTSMPNSELCV